MLVLDISCQHMGDECKLKSFCAPFGRRVGECTFLKQYICIDYMLTTRSPYGDNKYRLQLIKVIFLPHACTLKTTSSIELCSNCKGNHQKQVFF